MTQAETPGLARPVRLVFALALAIDLGCAAWLVWRTAILEPYSDMFDWIVRYERFQADGDLGRYLWAPHNFHHMVWTFAILDLDTRVFGASSYLFLAVGVLSLTATATMLALVASRAAGPGWRLVAGGGAAALGVMGCHVLDASADINTTYLHALVFAVGAILLAEAPGGQTAGRRIATFACALAACLGSAAGLAVWPALLFGAWRRGERRWSLGVLAAAAAFGVAYALGQHQPINPALGTGGVMRVGQVMALFVNYLGLPWARGVPGAGWTVGLAMLLMALAAVALKGRAGASWPERAAIVLILFSLGTAGLAAIARSGAYDPALVPIRYAVFLIPLHVGLWILALPSLRRMWERRPRLAEGLVVAAAILMLGNQAAMAAYAVGSADLHLRAIAAFKAGQRSPQMLTTIHPNLAMAAALTARLKREGLYQRELRPDPAPSGSDTSASSTGR